jgi:hypothetical protein
MSSTSPRKNVSTEKTTPDPRTERVSEGVLCYLHLWAALHKHVQLAHDEIEPDIGLWSDLDGGYFAAFTQDSPTKLRRNNSYVCAIGEDGPMVGQLEVLPPSRVVKIPAEPLMLLVMMAKGGPQPAENALKQIEMLAHMIVRSLPRGKLKAV